MIMVSLAHPWFPNWYKGGWRWWSNLINMQLHVYTISYIIYRLDSNFGFANEHRFAFALLTNIVIIHQILVLDNVQV